MILLTPGPCMTSEAVRLAAAQPDMNHREPAYLDLIREVRQGLRQLSGGMIPFVLGGSGTSAMEAMVASVVKSGPILIVSDGYYSERMDEIFAIHRIEHHRLDFDWLKGWDVPQILEALEQRPWQAVVMTHHETTTGRLNPVDEVAVRARQLHIPVLVDAMSSLGADPLDFSLVDAVAASANKCLHGLPGAAFVLLAQPLDAVQPPRTYALNLEWFASDVPKMTAPMPALHSFRQALREFWQRGGQPGRLAEYQAKSSLLRAGLESKGYVLPIPPERRSCTLTLAPLPMGSTYDAFFEFCLSKGFVIYRSKGALADDFFQVSVMGEVRPSDIEQFLAIVPPYRG